MRGWPCLLLLIWTATAGATTTDATSGEAIFRYGVLSGGRPLRGERSVGLGVEGIAAACATCHRRSGLGMTEGRIVIPPIIGKYLFRSQATNVTDMSMPHVLGFRATRVPYTESTLARAIRGGINSSGRRLDELMPRYALDDRTMGALIAYLGQLSAGPMRGVTDDTLHFATIVTPDADPVDRRGMLEVMQHFFDDKNSFIRGGSHVMKATREVEYRVTRRWQLHVWELTGAPGTWRSQLQAKLAKEPVFAAISGLGRGTWAPVHEFCQQAALPCLLPNINLPKVAEQDFYPVYFSRGVWLEADLLLERLRTAHRAGMIRRVVQVYRLGDIGAPAAEALQTSAKAAGLAVQMRALVHEGGGNEELPAAVEGLTPEDALVLWLRPQDLAALPDRVPAAGQLLVSGLMGDLESAPLPPAWHRAVRMTYPLDLPELRKVRMNFPLGWFRIHRIAPTAERVQTDTYVACGILAEALGEMLDSFVPDYLLERTEDMLSHRLTNGYYPRLTLGPGQRFASKGGYVVRFAADTGEAIDADGDWAVP
jgi:hypothetical protein